MSNDLRPQIPGHQRVLYGRFGRAGINAVGRGYQAAAPGGQIENSSGGNPTLRIATTLGHRPNRGAGSEAPGGVAKDTLLTKVPPKHTF